MPALPALPVAVPLLAAAVLVAGTHVLRRRVADSIAIATAAAVTLLSAVLLVRTFGGTVVTWFGGWTPRGGVALGVAFAVDPIGAGLATLAGLLMVAALTFSWRYFDTVGTLFHALMLTFLASVVGFCSSGDLFNLFVFLELLSVSAFALAGYKIEDAGSLQGALTFAVTNSIGAFLVLGGVALLYGRSGALNLAQVGQALEAGPADRLVVVAFALLVAGFLVKAAVVPFHFWLADAYAVAPTPVCVLLAGIISELGLYAVARLYWTVFSGPLGAHEGELRALLLGAAALTALVGGVMCLLQRHLARVLAYATVSHGGLTLVGIALLGPAGLGGAILYAATDGMVKAGLFVLVGVIAHRFGTLEELELRGRGRELGWAAPLLALGALGLAGLPPFGTFVAKALVEDGAGAARPWVSVLFTVASALTAASVLRAAGCLFAGWGPGRAGATPAPAPEAPDPDPAPDPAPDPEDELRVPRWRISPSMLLPAVVLLAGALVVGLLPGLSQRAELAAARFADRPAYVAAVLAGEAAPRREAVEPPAAGRLAGAAPWSVAAVLLAAGLALAGLLGERLPRGARRWQQRLGAPIVAALRSLHGGHLADSVTWLTIGTATLGVLLAVALR